MASLQFALSHNDRILCRSTYIHNQVESLTGVQKYQAELQTYQHTGSIRISTKQCLTSHSADLVSGITREDRAVSSVLVCR